MLHTDKPSTQLFNSDLSYITFLLHASLKHYFQGKKLFYYF